MSFSKEISKIIALLLINLLYASVGIFTKLASQYDFLSWSYIVFFGIAVGIIGIYAILWQQLIKRIDLTTACVFKGTGLIYAMLFAYFIFSIISSSVFFIVVISRNQSKETNILFSFFYLNCFKNLTSFSKK